MTVTADPGTVGEVAQIVGHEVRHTDLIGVAQNGTLSAALLDADFENSQKVIDRVVQRIDELRLPCPAANLAWRRLLPDARDRCRRAQKTGALAAGRQLARGADRPADDERQPLTWRDRRESPHGVARSTGSSGSAISPCSIASNPRGARSKRGSCTDPTSPRLISSRPGIATTPATSGGAPLIGLAWRGAELAGCRPLTVRSGQVDGFRSHASTSRRPTPLPASS